MISTFLQNFMFQFFYFGSWQNCGWGLVECRYKNHLVKNIIPFALHTCWKYPVLLTQRWHQNIPTLLKCWYIWYGTCQFYISMICRNAQCLYLFWRLGWLLYTNKKIWDREWLDVNYTAVKMILNSHNYTVLLQIHQYEAEVCHFHWLYLS